jgi:uncharacterized iron-regulated membrane protein
MLRFARWHIWLGWLVAVPLILWTVSGLFMTLRPIEEVRGDHLRAEARPIDASKAVVPALPLPVNKLALIDSGGRAVWVAVMDGQRMQRFAGDSGQLMGPVQVNEARILAERAFAGDATLSAIRRFSAEDAPFDLRRARPSWQAEFSDGTRIYIDADTGEVLALRTQFWRAFDFMWGLHIMDPLEREDTSHPLLWIAGGLSIVSVILGTALLFRRRRNRKVTQA